MRSRSRYGCHACAVCMRAALDACMHACNVCSVFGYRWLYHLWQVYISCLASHGMCVCLQPGSGNVEVSSKAEKGVESLSDVPWKRFLKSKALWGLIAVHCSFGVGPLVCLSWLPSYYSDVSLSHILLAYQSCMFVKQCSFSKILALPHCLLCRPV